MGTQTDIQDIQVMGIGAVATGLKTLAPTRMQIANTSILRITIKTTTPTIQRTTHTGTTATTTTTTILTPTTMDALRGTISGVATAGQTLQIMATTTTTTVNFGIQYPTS